MVQRVLNLDALPGEALDAAASFHRDHLGPIGDLLASELDSLVICLPAAPGDHDDWRRAAARDLGRRYAPKRVNIVGGSSRVEVEAITAYLEGAPGITGQYLAANEQNS